MGGAGYGICCGLDGQANWNPWLSAGLRYVPARRWISYAHFAVARTPNFRDEDMTYLLPPNVRQVGGISMFDPMCKYSQLTFNYTLASPMLVTSIGSIIVLMYQENGHVTRDPSSNAEAEVYVYATKNSLPNDALLDIHNKWNENGSGGDRRGRLIFRGKFDDGKCYQVNETQKSKDRQALAQRPHELFEGSNLWCEARAVVPDDLLPGDILTLYWVWDRGVGQGKPAPEIYTTCLDVMIR